MIFNFSPQRSDMARPLLTVAGDVLTVDGEACDLSGVQPVGAVLPGEAIDHPAILRAERTGLGLAVTILLPVGPSPTPAQSFPQSVTVASGAVALP